VLITDEGIVSELARLVRLRAITPAQARAREAATNSEDSVEQLQTLFGPKSSARLANALDPAEYRRKKLVAIKAGIIPQGVRR
jgi:hypothetical protein